MKEKEMYTFNELLDNLKIPVSELCRRARVTEGTVTRIKRGFPTRRSTINKLLGCLSDIYERELSLDNVVGLDLENRVVTEKRTNLPVRYETVDNATAIEVPQISPTTRNLGGAPKTEVPVEMPDSTVRLIDFVEIHGLPQSSMSRWISTGVKKGEKIETTAIPRASGPGMQHFLTPAQQEKALEILSRHGKLKTEQPEQEEEKPWYSKEGE